MLGATEQMLLVNKQANPDCISRYAIQRRSTKNTLLDISSFFLPTVSRSPVNTLSLEHDENLPRGVCNGHHLPGTIPGSS